jgi:hypothetical protein
VLEVLGLGYVPVTVGGVLGERAWSVPVRQAVRRAVAAVLYTAAGQECCEIGNAGARATLNVSFYIFGYLHWHIKRDLGMYRSTAARSRTCHES